MYYTITTRPGKYFPNIIDTKILTRTDEFLKIIVEVIKNSEVDEG